MTTSATAPKSSSLLPLKRALLRPVLWVRNLRGYWKSRGFSDPSLAAQGLGKVNDRWRRKIDTVTSSPDNKYIPRVADAGKIEGGLITMHNGIKVGARGYYGDGYLNLLNANKGVHEPQEERAFADVLKLLKPSSVMLELGSYWAFYSLWFSKEVPNAQCHMVEPNYACLLSGKGNFSRQGLKGQFTQAYVGDKMDVAGDGTDIISVDAYCQLKGISHLAILHADIQGAEVNMLVGANHMLTHRKIDYIFISSHSNELHNNCVTALQSHGYIILASADIDDTYSGDGLIVARGPHVDGPDTLPISLRSRDGAAVAH